MRAKFGNHRRGFTLIEIMIVVAVITLIALIAVPAFMRAWKRSQASTTLSELRLLEAAVNQYAIDNNKTSGATVRRRDWKFYIKEGTRLYGTGTDILGNRFGVQTVDQIPGVPGRTRNALSDVADSDFWSPFQ